MSLGASFQFLCNHRAAIIFPISRTVPIIITEVVDPGKMVASPIMLKYAAMQEMLKAETSVVSANIIVCVKCF